MKPIFIRTKNPRIYNIFNDFFIASEIIEKGLSKREANSISQLCDRCNRYNQNIKLELTTDGKNYDVKMKKLNQFHFTVFNS